MLINCLCKVQLSITKTKSVHSNSYSSDKVQPLCMHVKNGLIKNIFGHHISVVCNN